MDELPEEMAENYGFGTEDTPMFPNMHEASSLLVGGTLTAVDQVMTGQGTSMPFILAVGFIMAFGKSIRILYL